MTVNREYSEIVLNAEDAVLKEMFNTSIEELKAPNRKGNVVMIRFMAIYLYRYLTDETQAEICEKFSRDRSTIYHALDAAEAEKEFNRNFRLNYKQFEKKVIQIISETQRHERWRPVVGFTYWTIEMVNGEVIPREIAWQQNEECNALYERGLVFLEKIETKIICITLNNEITKHKNLYICENSIGYTEE